MVKKISVGQSWQVSFLKEKIKVPRWIITQGEKAISKWQEVFPVENSWVQKEFNLPSLIVRVEGVPDFQRKKFNFFEIEERPAGIGIFSEISPEFFKKINRLIKIWPDFKVVMSSVRQGAGDDYLWRTIISPEEIKDSDLLLIRAEPNESEFHDFLSQSVSSLLEKGNKSYGEKMNWWFKVKSEKDLRWRSAFVLKPCQGSKARGIEIWDPVHKRKGASTKSRILRTLKKSGFMYHQPLIQPLNHAEGMMMYRMVYGYNPSISKWIYLGGVYNIRPSLRIHGASDALFGPLC